MTGSWRQRLQAATPLGVLALMIAVFVTLPALSGQQLTSFSVYSALQTYGAYGLVALALGLTLLAGEFDLSTVGMFALGGMLAVKLGEASPYYGILAAVGVGLVAGLVQGTIIARLGVNSMSVTLGGYLILQGSTATIGHDKVVAYENVDFSISLDQQILTILSPHSLVVLGGFVVVGLLLTFTRIGRDVRAVGGDHRMARVAGVRVNTVVVGVFVASGILSGLAGALNSLSLASALPNPGLAPLVFAVTAVLIGGVAITGGQGGAAGIAAGALALSLLQSTFGILASPGWVTDVVTGSILAVAVALTAPQLADRWRTARQVLRRKRVLTETP